MLTQIYVAIWRHQATMSQSKKKNEYMNIVNSDFFSHYTCSDIMPLHIEYCWQTRGEDVILWDGNFLCKKLCQRTSLIQPFWCKNWNIPEVWCQYMGADALAPCITRPSAAMVLTIQNTWKWVLIFGDVGFQRSVHSLFWEVIENANIFFMFLII